MFLFVGVEEDGGGGGGELVNNNLYAQPTGTVISRRYTF